MTIQANRYNTRYDGKGMEQVIIIIIEERSIKHWSDELKLRFHFQKFHFSMSVFCFRQPPV